MEQTNTHTAAEAKLHFVARAARPDIQHLEVRENFADFELVW